MTAISIPKERREYGSKIPYFLLLILLFISLAVVETEHAVIKHGTEAQRIRNCINKNGPYMTFRGTGQEKNQWYIICQLNENTFGLQALVCEAGKLLEKTAFVPKDGTWANVLSYVTRFATKYTGEIPCQ
jgi:hypothetical protein